MEDKVVSTKHYRLYDNLMALAMAVVGFLTVFVFSFFILMIDRGIIDFRFQAEPIAAVFFVSVFYDLQFVKLITVLKQDLERPLAHVLILLRINALYSITEHEYCQNDF